MSGPPVVCFVCCCGVCSKLAKLELVEELNLSGNKLKTIPSTVSSCKRLHTLIAHSNLISVFPEILNLPEIKASHAFDTTACVCVCGTPTVFT